MSALIFHFATRLDELVKQPRALCCLIIAQAVQLPSSLFAFSLEPRSVVVQLGMTIRQSL